MSTMTSLKPTLHHLNNSQSQRILWLLEELEIPYELKLHQRGTEGPRKHRAPQELQETHPLGKAPQLETGDGRTIVESLAIAKYLIETYDSAGKFKGDGGRNDWVRDEELCNIAAASIGPIMNLELIFTFLLQALPFFIKPLFSLAHKQLQKAYIAPEFELYFKYLEAQLGEQDYFLGANPGRVDIIMKWPLDMCKANGYIDLAKYPNLDKWYTRVKERPAWKRSLEKGNGYAFETKL